MSEKQLDIELSEGGQPDAVTAATSLSAAAAALDPGSGQASLPPCAPPGMSMGLAEEVDATTGATPGVASACKDLGLNSLDEVSRQRGIKPPGMA